MTRFSRKPAVVAAVAALLVALGGCYWHPERTPYDAGIPEARLTAQAELDDAESRLTFSDQVIILGSGQTDSCDEINPWWFDNSVDPGLACWMRSTTLAVIPSAVTRFEVAAALDDEMASIDLPYHPGSAIRDFVSLYPNLRSAEDAMPVGGSGYEGWMRFSVQAEPYRAEFWNVYSNVGSVSSNGDLSEVTAAKVEATGASEFITISIEIEYWDSEGSPDNDPVQYPKPESDAVAWVEHQYGDVRGFEIADWAPTDSLGECFADPMIDQSNPMHIVEPARYVWFSILPEARTADLRRIRECFESSLTTGTVVEYSPMD